MGTVNVPGGHEINKSFDIASTQMLTACSTVSSLQPVQMTPSALPPPSIHTASLVASECGYYQLVVDGEDFNQDYTEIYFEPLLRTDGAWKKASNLGLVTA